MFVSTVHFCFWFLNTVTGASQIMAWTALYLFCLSQLMALSLHTNLTLTVTPGTPLRPSEPSANNSPTDLRQASRLAAARKEVVRGKWRKIVQQQMLLLRIEQENARLDAARTRTSSSSSVSSSASCCIHNWVLLCHVFGIQTTAFGYHPMLPMFAGLPGSYARR